MRQADLRKGPPPVPADLVEWLEALYPDRFPTVQGNSVSAIAVDMARCSGRLEVVRLLRDHLTRQTRPTAPNSATA